MKIERLLFQVEPKEFVKDFLKADAEVWNPWLQRQSGFLNKTSRIIGSNQVEFLIFWKSENDLKRAKNKVEELKVVDNLLRQRSPGRFFLLHSSNP